MIPMLPSPLDIGPQVWGKQLRHFFGVYDMVDERKGSRRGRSTTQAALLRATQFTNLKCEE